MDLWEAARVVGRHWLVVAIGVVLALTASAMAYERTEPRYEAKGAAIVIPSAALVDPATQRVIENPYSAQRDLMSAAHLAGEIGRGNVVAKHVRAQGGTGDYAVDVAPQAPIISVTAIDIEIAGAVRTVQALLEGLAQELRNRQSNSGVPAGSQIVLDLLSVPESALLLNANRVKSTGLVAALGVLAAISLAFLAEAIQQSRRSARSRRVRSDDEAPDDYDTRPGHRETQTPMGWPNAGAHPRPAASATSHRPGEHVFGIEEPLGSPHEGASRPWPPGAPVG